MFSSNAFPWTVQKTWGLLSLGNGYCWFHFLAHAHSGGVCGGCRLQMCEIKRVASVVKLALSAVTDNNRTTALHNFPLWFTQSGLKAQPIQFSFPVDVPGHISVGIITLK